MTNPERAEKAAEILNQVFRQKIDKPHLKSADSVGHVESVESALKNYRPPLSDQLRQVLGNFKDPIILVSRLQTVIPALRVVYREVAFMGRPPDDVWRSVIKKLLAEAHNMLYILHFCGEHPRIVEYKDYVNELEKQYASILLDVVDNPSLEVFDSNYYINGSLLEQEFSLIVQLLEQKRRSTIPAPSLAVLYLDDESQYALVKSELAQTLSAFGLEIVDSSNPVIGSIWQAFVAVFKRQATPDRLDDAASVAIAGTKARWYGEPQSQITKSQAEAISSLLATLENTQNALLAFSNILILKVDGVPLVRELTPDQVEHLQRNPRLYSDPRLALGILDVGSINVREGNSEKGQRASAP